MSAYRQKQLNLSWVGRQANGWFEPAFIVGDAALALGGSEPSFPNAVLQHFACAGNPTLLRPALCSRSKLVG